MFERFTNITYALVFLVILAGGIVRMTGSGMGCPDWPKCFGHWVPPTDISELEWRPKGEFKNGQMILVDGKLYKAMSSFTSQENFDNENWELFKDHEYSVYNVTHTYVEYANRLIGALLGFASFLMLLTAFRARERKKAIWASVSVFVLIGFEGWLGAKVVSSVLAPYKVTIHMLVAFIILGFLAWVQSWQREEIVAEGSGVRRLGWLAILFVTLQIVLGTQVREQIDGLVEQLVSRSMWMDSVDWMFYVHRTFSILVTAVVVAFGWKSWKATNADAAKRSMILIVLIVAGSVLSGVIMNYFGMPAIMQPMHLFLSASLFAVLIALLFRIKA